MLLSALDWIIICLVLFISLTIGFYAARKSGRSSTEYFLSGKQMPWWLLGISMVATTFSTDTPNLVTDLVRQNGVSGNWVWWAFLLTGMLTVFVYARLWRKSNINTDLEFYELRYGGKGAEILRGFRAIYLGVLFNVLAMSGVILAAIKIGEVMLGLSALETVGISCTITVIFSALGGFRGVILTDLMLFVIAMIGAIGAAIVAINHPEVNGLSNLFTHENVADKLSFVPSPNDGSMFYAFFLIPLAVQWWSSWYPGAEPGGGGYVAQRMLAAKNEKDAMASTLLFNIAHYALRPWPWILVGLASLIVFPDLESLQAAFPNVSTDKLGHDLGYPAMLTFLPTGLLGLVLASLIAAFMSTISSHLNWGSSYIVFDFYKRFISPNASEKSMVRMGRLSTLFLMILSAVFALSLKSAAELFSITLMFGAGTGLIFILRWFWWRINIWSEISAMIFSGIISLLFHKTELFSFLPDVWSFPFSVLLTTIIWLIFTFLTKPEDEATLVSFYEKIQPYGSGWKPIAPKASITESETWSMSTGILAFLSATFMVYSLLFGVGYILYGEMIKACILSLVFLLCLLILSRLWPKLT